MWPLSTAATLATAAVVAAGAAGWLWFRPAATEPFLDGDGRMVAGSVALLEQVEINGVRQWLHIRGRDVTNPVLLFVHGGPGTPETIWLDHYNRELADDFVVVAWEQRGAGRSYRAGRADPAAMTLAQLIDDTLAVTAHLKERLDQERILLVGHS